MELTPLIVRKATPRPVITSANACTCPGDILATNWAILSASSATLSTTVPITDPSVEKIPLAPPSELTTLEIAGPRSSNRFLNESTAPEFLNELQKSSKLFLAPAMNPSIFAVSAPTSIRSIADMMPCTALMPISCNLPHTGINLAVTSSYNPSMA
ncbi:Uncharacterised protein [Chlamydia trachomatis]|nr:Uncharacterised protein [Chlamydia trachomatis]